MLRTGTLELDTFKMEQVFVKFGRDRQREKILTGTQNKKNNICDSSQEKKDGWKDSTEKIKQKYKKGEIQLPIPEIPLSTLFILLVNMVLPGCIASVVISWNHRICWLWRDPSGSSSLDPAQDTPGITPWAWEHCPWTQRGLVLWAPFWDCSSAQQLSGWKTFSNKCILSVKHISLNVNLRESGNKSPRHANIEALSAPFSHLSSQRPWAGGKTLLIKAHNNKKSRVASWGYQMTSLTRW